jgi:hypothetical protein
LHALKKSGLPVTQAWLDQNCCYWSRKYGRKDGLDGRKKDVYFWDSHGQLFPPMRTKSFATGVVKAQIFMADSWYNLDEYWQPAYESIGLDATVWRRIDEKRSSTTQAWSKSIGRDGSICSYRRKLCKGKDETYTLF